MDLISDVIYLDNSFVVDAYQKLRGKEAPIKYSKTTDVSAGINMVVSTGASLKETFEYSINSYMMYDELLNDLKAISEITIDNNNIKNLPELFWMEGLFGIVSITSNPNKPDEVKSYSFSAQDEKENELIYLSTNNIYFSTGYDQLLANSVGFGNRFVIKARLLLKSLGTSGNLFIASPMVVIKLGNHSLN